MTKKEREIRAAMAEILQKGQTILAIANRTQEQKEELSAYTVQLKELQAQLEECTVFENAQKALYGTPINQFGTHQKMSLGEILQARAIKDLSREIKDNKVRIDFDDRIKNAAGNNELTGVDGGYLVGMDYVNDMTAAMYDASVIARSCARRKISESSNRLSISYPKRGFGTNDEIYGGLSVAYVAEEDALSYSKAGFENIEMKLKKVGTILPLTNEIISDAYNLEQTVLEFMREGVAISTDNSIMHGDGSTKDFVGVLSTANKNGIAVAQKDATKLTAYDVETIFRSVLNPERCTWYMNRDMHALLETLNTVAGFPIYLPNNNIAGAPFGTLKGRPILFSDASNGINKAGDILLGDFSQYIIADKRGIQTAVSTHFLFENDQIALRITYRADGSPKYKTAFNRPKKQGGTLANFAWLADGTRA